MAKDKIRKRLYSIYNGMKQRCYNPKRDNYKWYGAKGIKICETWLNDFESFVNWALTNGYKETLTIDRIDHKGNYSPYNCRWATQKEQVNNSSKIHLITYKGETHSLVEWATISGINYSTFRDRVRTGKKLEDIFRTGYLERRRA